MFGSDAPSASWLSFSWSCLVPTRARSVCDVRRCFVRIFCARFVGGIVVRACVRRLFVLRVFVFVCSVAALRRCFCVARWSRVLAGFGGVPEGAGRSPEPLGPRAWSRDGFVWLWSCSSWSSCWPRPAGARDRAAVALRRFVFVRAWKARGCVLVLRGYPEPLAWPAPRGGPFPFVYGASPRGVDPPLR